MVERFVTAGDGTPTTQRVEVETATFTNSATSSYAITVLYREV